MWFDEFGNSGFCSVARGSSTCAAQVRSVNLPSSHASIIAAGLPAAAIRADTMMLVTRTTRLSGFVSLPVGAAFRADLADGFVDDALDFIGVGIGVGRPDVLYGALKHAPADCFLVGSRRRSAFAAKGGVAETGDPETDHRAPGIPSIG